MTRKSPRKCENFDNFKWKDRRLGLYFLNLYTLLSLNDLLSLVLQKGGTLLTLVMLMHFSLISIPEKAVGMVEKVFNYFQDYVHPVNFEL